eukprot:2514958-Pleurochrysis_carterae.AAC.1
MAVVLAAAVAVAVRKDCTMCRCRPRAEKVSAPRRQGCGIAACLRSLGPVPPKLAMAQQGDCPPHPSSKRESL